ncbi:MAG: hypothetical protein LC802_09990, partial [Acidobacteria bacterium]|nr:hypothetical protein [Acidobacteriota bacterium]
RVVTFTYDDNHNPLSITQSWGAQTHTWATFGYGAVTVQHGFSGLSVRGPASGQAINVLTQVGLPDGSRYQFDYNAYGQVAKITRLSADGNQLSYTAYDYGAGANDCPRVSGRRDWALDWNNGAEAVTAYAYAGDYSWGAATAPDQTLYKEVFATAGWQAGLTTGTEVWVGGVKQKYTDTGWTQDDTNLAYRLNPRATASHVGDADGNHRRTSVEYYTAAELGLNSNFGLVKEVKEYEADATSALEQTKVLRRSHTDYDFGPAFTASRVIGLASARYVYGKNPATGNEELYSKTTYAYDETTGERLVATKDANGTAVNPTQHDASFGTTFTARGNLTGARRWNVKTVDADNPAYVEGKIGYDTDGSVVFSIDPLGHRAEVGYSDSFADGNIRNTFAYPTSATDPDQVGQQSPQRALTRYEFSTGAVTRTQGLSPNLSLYPTGPVQTMSYDEVGRISRVERETDGDGATLSQANRPHTRYVYSPGQTWAQSFTTIRDEQTEVYSIQVMDGVGRTYASAADFPGTGGNYRAQHTVYDVMGRAVRASTPTQVTTGWEPVDEDTADNLPAGWYYSTQDYDWKGRPTYSGAHGQGGGVEPGRGQCLLDGDDHL